MAALRVRVFATPERAARALAAEIAAAVNREPRIVLGLPTGRTPVPLYRELAVLYRRGRLDLAHVTTFNLDEFVGVNGNHQGSYRAFMQAHLFQHVNLAGRRIQFLDGAAPDPERECERYERTIRRAGGLDLLILGLGANGHIGFNEPAPQLAPWTHRTRLTRATRAANAVLFDNRLSRVPREALSMGMATILHARRIVMLATGAEKARAVAAMLHGPVTPRLPASFLQLHQNVDVWLDRGSARLR